MPYYNTCKSCGCNLDPGEVCDCQSKDKEKSTLDTTNTKSALVCKQESVKISVQQLQTQYITKKSKCQ